MWSGRGFGQYLSMCLFCFRFFSDAASRLGGAKPHADERSEKARRLSAGSVPNSGVLYGNSVKHFSLVLQAPCRQPLELDERLRRAGVAARRSTGPVISHKRNGSLLSLGILGATSDDGRSI